jgi:hypothetical protein
MQHNHSTNGCQGCKDHHAKLLALVNANVQEPDRSAASIAETNNNWQAYTLQLRFYKGPTADFCLPYRRQVCQDDSNSGYCTKQQQFATCCCTEGTTACTCPSAAATHTHSCSCSCHLRPQLSCMAQHAAARHTMQLPTARPRPRPLALHCCRPSPLHSICCRRCRSPLQLLLLHHLHGCWLMAYGACAAAAATAPSPWLLPHGCCYCTVSMAAGPWLLLLHCLHGCWPMAAQLGPIVWPAHA